MSNYREQSEWSAEQVLAYIVNLEAADDQNEYHAFATAYNYFMNLGKKKISWSVHLQKLAYEFIELAFDNNKHSSIKDVLKSYRSLTQGQYSQSLKDVLEHYRDRKLQAILEEDILHENLDLIRDLPNIESEEASSTIIFSSFRPAEKRKLQDLRNKLKIVWEGYKYIIETVKINQKLQDVFKETLNKVFVFVEKYNRKHEFKSFCKTLKQTLRIVLNKRERTEQQRSIYIDIEKTEVNDRNIEIRLDQFKVTIKLGLWQQAFQVLEDINNLMRVRKGGLKSNIRYKYFENLALLFKKSNYWHYHAFAFYNKFLAAQKNPKLTPNERKELSDELLLSVLCIPPVTLQSNQSRQSQQKISSMMISSTKLPTKSELSQLIVAAGISENASSQIRNLWSFMSLQFDLESLAKGLEFLNQITNQNYSEFKTLIEDILIYRQLQSISEIYQRIKIESLLSLIPLSKQKIQRILLSSYHQKILDFIMDQDQKIIIFEDKSSEKESNPTEKFFEIYVDLAIEKEKQREDDSKHILNKLQQFVESSEEYYWKIRQYKIEQFRKKLKKPKQQLLNEAHRRKVQQQQERERLQAEKLAKQSEALKLAEEKKKEFGAKKIIINDIKDIKQSRVVRVTGKKIEELTDEEIENISIETLNNALEETKTKIQNNRDVRYKRAFNQIDYLERQRRERIGQKIKELIPSKEQEDKSFEQIKKGSRNHHDEQKSLRQKISKMMTYLKPKIQQETNKLEEKYEFEMNDFKQRLSDYYKDKIIARAKALAKQNKEKKELEEKKMREAEAEMPTGKWTFKGMTRVAGTLIIASKQQPISFSKKLDTKPDSQLQKVLQTKEKWARKKFDQQKKEESVTVPSTQKWGRKQEPKQQIPVQQPVIQNIPTNTFVPAVVSANTFVPPVMQKNTFVPPVLQKKSFVAVPAVQKRGFGLGIGLAKKTEDKKEEKKQEGKPKPKKSYVNVN